MRETITIILFIRNRVKLRISVCVYERGNFNVTVEMALGRPASRLLITAFASSFFITTAISAVQITEALLGFVRNVARESRIRLEYRKDNSFKKFKFL